jgi:two-component system sensor histidine kinase AgrC
MKGLMPEIISAAMLGAAWVLIVQFMVSRESRLKTVKFLAFAFVVMFMYFLSLRIPFEILGLVAWLLVSTLLTLLFYKTNLVQAVLYAFTFLVMDLLSQFLPFILRNTVIAELNNINGWIETFVENIIAIILSIIFLLAWNFFSRIQLRKLYRHLSNWLENLSPSHVVIGFIFLMIFIAMAGLLRIYRGVIQYSDGRVQFSFFVILLFLPIINILGFLLYRVAIRNKLKLDEQKKEYERLLTYTGIIETLTRDMRAFRHDLNNVLLSLRGFIDNNDMEGLKRYYFGEILKNQSSATDESSVFLNLEYFKCIPLKGLLTTAIQRALKQGVKVSVLIDDYFGDTGIQAIDLCRMVGIFLDNAIEAAVESKDKVISISVLHDERGRVMSLIIANSFLERPDMSQLNREGYSTKGVNRGMGLSTLQKILKGYHHATLNTVIENQFFIQELNFSYPDAAE